MSKQNRRVRRHRITGELLIENGSKYVSIYGEEYSSDDIIDKRVRIPKDYRLALGEGIETSRLIKEKLSYLNKVICLDNQIKKRQRDTEKKIKKIKTNLTKDEFIHYLTEELTKKYKKVDHKNLKITSDKDNLIITITNQLNVTDSIYRKVTRIQNDTCIINKSTPESRYEIELLLENARTFYNPENLNFKESLIVNNDNLEYKLEKIIPIKTKFYKCLAEEIIEKIAA